MPAYNAETTLRRTVSDIPDGLATELILVDDASPDATVAVARELGLKVTVHAENRGYGANQKTCYTEALRAGADIVVLLHPDYQYDPKAVPLLIAPILAGDADMTFGSRFAGLGDPLRGGMPLYRYWGNRITSTVENLMLGSRFTDMHSGMRAYTRRCLQALPFLRYSDDFIFDSQMLIDAVTTGQRVVEVPIPTRYTKESSSIAVAPSLRYVSGSVAHAATRALSRGRRGRRSPVAAPPRRRGPMLPQRGDADWRCVLCGSLDHGLVYPANVAGDVAPEEFRCTTGALAQHDDILQCRNCGLVGARTPLSDADLAHGYEEVVDEEYLIEETERHQVFDWFAERMEGYTTEGRRLLEFGANVGMFLSRAHARGWDVRGIEPSAWAVKTGRERYGVPLAQGRIEEHTEPDASADAIVMLDVLEHLNDPVAALERINPILHDDGILVLSTVNLSGLHARLRGGDWPWFIRSHLYYFSPETLAAVLDKTGFRMVGWNIVPRSFHLSYITARAGDSHPGLARIARRLTEVADPKVPVGWLGDITMVVARRVG